MWPKNGCLHRRRGRDGPGAVSANIWLAHTWAHIGAWSAPGGPDHPRLVTSSGSRHEAHLRPCPEAGLCLVPVFRSCLWSAVSVTLLARARAACAHSGSHWDVHCVRCRDQLSTGPATRHSDSQHTSTVTRTGHTHISNSLELFQSA